MARSYNSYVEWATRRHPSLTALSDFLNHDHLQKESDTVTLCLQISSSQTTCEKITPKDILDKIRTHKTSSHLDSPGLVILVENIHRQGVEALGRELDINPFFFGSHVATTYEDVAKTPLPPLAALPPSQIVAQDFVHVHYQRVLDLGDESQFKNAPRKFEIASNVPRSMRRTQALSGREIGIARACTSIYRKKLDNGRWICKCYNSKFLYPLLIYVCCRSSPDRS
jgi:hypothetical protein